MSGVASGRGGSLALILAYLALGCLLVLFLFPALWMVGLSLKTRPQIFSPEHLLFWSPTLANYAAVLARGDFLQGMLSSFVTAIGAVLLSLLVGVPAAYGFARFTFRGSRLLFYALLLMRMLPPIAVLVPMYVLFSRVGLANTYVAVILAYTTFSLPLVVWILRDFFDALPRELEESAWVDGASRLQTFRLVIFPLVRPGLAAVSILSLLLAWNDFLFASVLTNNSTRTLPVLLAGYASGDTGVDWGPMSATGVLVVLPVIVFSFFAQRHLVTGLSAGAVKG